jgi:hypothetical protein
MMFFTTSDRQFSTILAALRLWQDVCRNHHDLITPQLQAIAADDHGDPLGLEEVGALYEAINGGVQCQNREFVEMTDGFDKIARYLDAVTLAMMATGEIDAEGNAVKRGPAAAEEAGEGAGEEAGEAADD